MELDQRLQRGPRVVAVVGGPLIGLAEAYTKTYQERLFPWAGANVDQVVPYVVMLVVLAVILVIGLLVRTPMTVTFGKLSVTYCAFRSPMAPGPTMRFTSAFICG